VIYASEPTLRVWPGFGSGGTGHAVRWAQLNWFGYLLLVAGPVVLHLRRPYP
jgi:hypothetical protein